MEYLIPIAIALPFVLAVPAYVLSKKQVQAAYAVMIAACTAVFAMLAYVFVQNAEPAFQLNGILSLNISFKADGFRSMYALVAAFMWLMTSLFAPQYFHHGHAQGRYAMFTLLTLGATLGVFLSNDLITAFLFFEILSFTSYCWVIHEETPGAMRAGQTYLAIAILGGMAMLMGLMLLHVKTGTLAFEALPQALQGIEVSELYLPGALILAGFGAKAGMYPLHVWLPKAHPVAPAPASALLSGILTKVGIYGILVLSTRLFFDDVLWGNLLLGLGLINMLLGAVLALFSTDLKRTLACSSMSQIGFILLGVGMQSLLGEHNALAAQGTVLHMLNHSLIKLVLFMAAGVVYLNTHSLNLNEIQGYGRRKPGLMLIFMTGAASISGIPFFSGYASKTLLHEAVIEYVHHLDALGHNSTLYQGAEWLFVITGGITFCYMLKLFIVIFVQKHPTRQEEHDKRGRSMSALSTAALGLSALVLFALGLRPEGALTALANRSLPFLLAHEPAHEVHYLAWVNLYGGGKSLILGLVLYVTVVRLWLIKKDANGIQTYINPWPQWLDLEDRLYRPVVSMLTGLGMLICRPLGAIERVFTALYAALTFVVRLFDSLVDAVSLLLMRTILKPSVQSNPYVPVGNKFTFGLGRLMDTLSTFFRSVLGIQPKAQHHYIRLYAAVYSTAQDTLRRMLKTLSFGLILFALAIVLFLAFLLIK